MAERERDAEIPGLVTGPSRLLPPPLDAVARGAWDLASFHGRRLARRLPPAFVQHASWAVERAQRSRLDVWDAEVGSGARLVYAGNDPVMRSKLLGALGASGDAAFALVGEGDPDELQRHAVPGTGVLTVEVPTFSAPPLARAGWLVLPRWVELEIDLRKPEAELWDARRRESIRRIERAGYVLEVASGDDAARDFYTRLFVPTARARHGPEAFIRRWRYVRAAASRGQLLFARQGRERLAGILVLPRLGDDRAQDAWLIGVAEGDYGVAPLAREAIYLHAIRWARDVAGADRLGLTTAAPLLSDGLLRYKKRWGASVVHGGRDGTALALRFGGMTEPLAHAVGRAGLVCLGFHGRATALWSPDVRRPGDAAPARPTPGVELLPVAHDDAATLGERLARAARERT